MDIERRRRDREDIWFRVVPQTSRPLSEFHEAVDIIDKLFIVGGSVFLNDSEFFQLAHSAHACDAYLKSQLWLFRTGVEFMEVKVSTTHKYILLKRKQQIAIDGTMITVFFQCCFSLDRVLVRHHIPDAATGEYQLDVRPDHVPMNGLVCCMCLQKTTAVHIVGGVQYCSLCFIPLATQGSEFCTVDRPTLPCGSEARFINRNKDNWGFSMDFP